jgi:hypothetical protein
MAALKAGAAVMHLGSDARLCGGFVVRGEPRVAHHTLVLPLGAQPLGQLETLAWPCRIARMAEASNALTRRHAAILGLLLTKPVSHDEGSILQPIWRNEALERAALMIELLATLDRRIRVGCQHVPTARIERQSAGRLAIAFQSADCLSGSGIQTCSDLLRYIVRDLVELFGPAVGEVDVTLEIERLALSSVRWRALILTTVNLVLRALCRAFGRRSFGTIAVCVRRSARGELRLTVADDGDALTPARAADDWGVLDDLAAVLDSRVIYRRGSHGGTVAEVAIHS